MPDLIGIDAGPAESVRIAARAGFGGLDLRLNRFTPEVERLGPEALSDAIGAAGLRPGYCSLTPQKVDVPEDEWAEGMRELPRRALVARVLGYTRATSVVVPFSDTLDRRANTRMHVKRTREAADVLADFGIRFGLEYVSPKTRWVGGKHPFVRDLSDMLGLLQDVDRPNAGVMLDCFHWHCAGETADDLRRLRAEQIVAVHVNDLVAGIPVDEQVVTERELPGVSGVVDLRVFLGTLAEMGYDGPVTAEPTHPRWRGMLAEEAARETAAAVNGCVRAGLAAVGSSVDS